jgi:hypothetical protein
MRGGIFSSTLLVAIVAVFAAFRQQKQCYAFSIASFSKAAMPRISLTEVKVMGSSSSTGRHSSLLSRRSSSPWPAIAGEKSAPGELLLSNQNNSAQTSTPVANVSMKPVLALFALALSLVISTSAPAAQAADSVAIAGCLLKQCRLPLAKCIANPKCLANVICINTCNGKPNETGCQIKCGDLFENEVVGEFNKCAVSDRTCVPQRPDDGSYPVPSKELTVPKFDTKLFNGRWYVAVLWFLP